MNTEKEIKEIKKARQRSGKAIPIESGSLVAMALILWIIAKVVSVPIWVTIIILGLIALTFLGDIINYIYCGRKLKTLFSKQ